MIYLSEVQVLPERTKTRQESFLQTVQTYLVQTRRLTNSVLMYKKGEYMKKTSFENVRERSQFNRN